MKWKECIGLGEVMNYLGVINGDIGILKKLRTAWDKTIDGHAPGVSNNNLNAYIPRRIGNHKKQCL